MRRVYFAGSFILTMFCSLIVAQEPVGQDTTDMLPVNSGQVLDTIQMFDDTIPSSAVCTVQPTTTGVSTALVGGDAARSLFFVEIPNEIWEVELAIQADGHSSLVEVSFDGAGTGYVNSLVGQGAPIVEHATYLASSTGNCCGQEADDRYAVCLIVKSRDTNAPEFAALESFNGTNLQFTNAAFGSIEISTIAMGWPWDWFRGKPKPKPIVVRPPVPPPAVPGPVTLPPLPPGAQPVPGAPTTAGQYVARFKILLDRLGSKKLKCALLNRQLVIVAGMPGGIEKKRLTETILWWIQQLGC